MSENCVPFKIRRENWKFLGPLLYTSFMILDHLIHPLNNKTINVTDTMLINRTSSVPKSVLHYELDKGQYFNLETSIT